MKITNKIETDSDVVIHQGDCIDFLGDIADKSIQLVITSPPYNMGKQYESEQSLEGYLSWQKPVISELVRVLHGEGSICWQVGNYVCDGEIVPLDIPYYGMFKEHGLKL